MELNQEDLMLLKKFQDNFKIITHSMATQELSVENISRLNSSDACVYGVLNYFDTYVYGDTKLIEIYHKEECVEVAAFEDISDDLAVILEYAREWESLGFPNPSDKNFPFKP